MKKLFILISTCLIALFITFLVIQEPDQISYQITSSVSVKTGSTLINKEKVDLSLDSFATKHHSIIVKRMVEPNPTGHKFVYKQYGDGKTPTNFVKASNEVTKTSSVLSQYIIVKGKLTDQELVDKFKILGYDAVIHHKTSPLMQVIAYLGSDSVLLSLFIFILTFMSLSIIYRIKDLRNAGIRIISGESLSGIIVKSIVGDFRSILISAIVSLALSSLIIILFKLMSLGLFLLLFYTVLSYSILLLFVSFVISLTYVIGLRKSGIVSIIKGRLPVKKLLSLMFLCQFVAIIVVGWGCSRIPLFYSNLKEENSASQEWSHVHNKFNISFGLSEAYINSNEYAEESKTWHNFFKEAFQKQGALLVENNLISFIGSDTSFNGERKTDYTPGANTLYVSPNYFDLQKISLNKNFNKKIESLQLGQFGLILPNKLKNNSQKYKEIYENYMNQFFKGNHVGVTSSSSIIEYSNDNTNQFIYNNTSISAQQFLSDPIIVVVTPQSLGDSQAAIEFWKNISDRSIFLSNYDKTINLLKKYKLLGSVSDLTNSTQSFYEQQTFFKTQTISLIASSILGLLTSVLLFNSMNLLYFEEFRKDIFLKRISGMSFIEIHQVYLSLMLLTTVLGFFLNAFLTKNIFTSLFTLSIFTINAFLILNKQMRKENKRAVSILKGK